MNHFANSIHIIKVYISPRCCAADTTGCVYIYDMYATPTGVPTLSIESLIGIISCTCVLLGAAGATLIVAPAARIQVLASNAERCHPHHAVQF